MIQGLRQTQPSIPPKYFYNQIGSKLFDAICETEEYYVTRTELLRQGNTLSQVTQQLSQALGIKSTLFPMTEQSVATFVRLENGSPLAFQEYFVKRQCEPKISGYYFQGIDAAGPSQGFLDSIQDSRLCSIILCPSNPFVSIEPILSVPGITAALTNHPAPVIAVSPIIAGQAVKGPTAKIMAELGLKMNSITVADYYQDIVSGFILDRRDAGEADAIRQIIPRVGVAKTLMQTLQDKIGLARETLDFVGLDV
ncbi:MAG: hypothetical protein COA75_13550 [Cellvibrionales bacterium]|nr:MAG: hypothetical protein COA75_13550 [Cellvibrionales bacterium]